MIEALFLMILMATMYGLILFVGSKKKIDDKKIDTTELFR